MNKERLLNIITAKLEEYGMPKFKDKLPAMDILKIIEDALGRRTETQIEFEFVKNLNK